MRRDKILRLIYSMVAFVGAQMLHNIDQGFVVFAQGQSMVQQQYEHRDWDRHDEKERQLDDHIAATDKHLGEVAEKVSMMSGVGAAVVAGLGVLNLLGFIRIPGRAEPVGKTHFITPE